MIDVRPNLVDRLFLLLDGVQGPPSLNLYALSVDGDWDYDVLRRAVEALLAEQPLLRTRSWRTTWRLGRVVRPVEAVEDVFRVGGGSPGVGHDNDEERAFMRAPLDLAQQPPVRILARPGRIVMGIHHAIADGIGGYYVLDRLAAHYQALLADTPVEPPPQAPPRPYGAYFRRFTPAERRKAVAGMGNVLREMLLPLGPYATFGDRPLPARGEFAWRELPVPPEAVAALRGVARARGGTLNDLLLAATAVAGCATWPNDPARPVLVMVPASLREGPAVDMTNRVAELPIIIPGEACRDFDQAFDAARVRTPMARDRGQAFARIFQYGLASRLPPPLVRGIVKRSLDRPENHALTYVFSNTGILDPQPRDFGPLAVKAVAGMPPLTMPPGLGVVAATARGHLTLTVAWADPALARPRIDAFCTTLLDTLARLAQEPSPA